VGLWEALHSFILWDSQTAVQREKKEKEKLNITVAIGEVKALHYLLIFSTTLDGFYFANCVLAVVFFLVDYQYFRK